MAALKGVSTSKEESSPTLPPSPPARPVAVDKLSLENTMALPSPSLIAGHSEVTTAVPDQNGKQLPNAQLAEKRKAPRANRHSWQRGGLLAIASLALAAGAYPYGKNQVLTPPVSSAGAPAIQPATLNLPAITVQQTAVLMPKHRLTAEDSPRPPVTPPFPRSNGNELHPIQLGQPESSPTLKISLARSRPEPDPQLLSGHLYLQQHKLDLASQDFAETLHRDPNNLDALLALAAIAHYQGRAADAEHLQDRALIANPGDSAAQAAVLNSRHGDPRITESRLKTLLATHPESAALNFALGNLYAYQQRWPEAQQAYFNALTSEGDNPDYLFNLAVSLEHIRQPRVAAQHYHLALEAADKRPAAFDREVVKKRLGDLHPEQQR